MAGIWGCCSTWGGELEGVAVTAGLGEIGLLAGVWTASSALERSAAPGRGGGVGVALLGCGFSFRPKRNGKHIGWLWLGCQVVACCGSRFRVTIVPVLQHCQILTGSRLVARRLHASGSGEG